MAEPVAYTKPSITDLEVKYAEDAARNGWGRHCYDYIVKLEKAFADYLGVSYAIATSSCTGAMHMGMHALGIGPGDEVILAETNWIATVSPIVHLGATPVFVDILPDSWCLDPACVEAAITPRTKAVIATHIYGNLCEMERLREICSAHDLVLIEDAAEALGSEYRGQKAGSIGRFGTFSFHGTKTMTTGEGGMFVTNDPDLFETVLTLSNHGRSRSQTRQFWPDMVGFKYKMSNIQAAIGCAQLERIEDLTLRKREILQEYKKRLSGRNVLRMNPEPAGTINGAWMPTVVFEPETGIGTADAIAAFRAREIDARVFFAPLSSLDFFSGQPQNEHAYDVASRAINLPSYHDMTTSDIDRVCDTIEGLLGD